MYTSALHKSETQIMPIDTRLPPPTVAPSSIEPEKKSNKNADRDSDGANPVKRLQQWYEIETKPRFVTLVDEDEFTFTEACAHVSKALF
jgi:hypothetical protein